jgi:hypothetical protein
MLQGLIAGAHDPAALAQMAEARMRNKIPELTEALNGRFTEHHAFLAQMHLDLIDRQSQAIDRGPMRALVAIEHSMLTSIWHMLTTHEPYAELGGDYYARLNPDRAKNGIIRQAAALGPTVTQQQHPTRAPPENPHTEHTSHPAALRGPRR